MGIRKIEDEIDLREAMKKKNRLKRSHEEEGS